MPQVALHPPRTALEVFNILPEGTLAQAINGKIYMSPAPSLSHQKVIVSLIGQIYNYLETRKSGSVFMAPIDVFLDDDNIFQPDIVFVSTENNSILQDRGIFGAPDLVIEVLSPGIRSVDLVTKKKIYERSGVKEYWVVDVTTKECIGFQLKAKKFSEFAREKSKLSSSLLQHVFTF